MGRPRKDLTGKQFSFWDVKMFDQIIDYHAYWWCECQCGRVESVRSDSLLNGSSEMCEHCSRFLTKHNKMPEHVAAKYYRMVEKTKPKKPTLSPQEQRDLWLAVQAPVGFVSPDKTVYVGNPNGGRQFQRPLTDDPSAPFDDNFEDALSIGTSTAVDPDPSKYRMQYAPGAARRLPGTYEPPQDHPSVIKVVKEEPMTLETLLEVGRQVREERDASGFCPLNKDYFETLIRFRKA